MKRTKTLVIALWAVFVNQVAFSQKGTEEQLVKDANNYFKTGEYLKAFPLYSQLVSLYPNHAEYNYKFGACAIYSESDKTKAVRFLNQAVNKGVEDPMAWYYLGKAYHLNYQFKDAIKAYETFIRNADPKVASKTDAQRQVETCIYGSNLLANIKDVSVISKTEADKANFFRYFNLEDIGGKILTIPDELKTKMDMKSTEPGVIHYPGNGTTIYFSSYGKDGANGKDIYKAQVLPDGKFSSPMKLEGDVNTKYDEDFCFMHSDGKTLYFASKGHNSMGGYDIFKSVYDPKEQKFGPAINLDFAINTPDDDIFYIADSLNRKAYFASGRASDLDHLNVYNVLVESVPLQVVYIKGDFISEINSEQHNAGIKINETGTGRMVCDGITNRSNGSYIMYVPKSGEYSFKVITENSPTVHDVKVNIPSFDRPVALRQEMRLVSDNGQDKLIVTNFFESPLEEDISALAAEMLRKKSNLEVNTTTESVVSTSTPKANIGGELRTFDQTIENATLAAGFSTGITLKDVVGEMNTEVKGIREFVARSDEKKSNSIAYAAKKQKEAEKALVEAEEIRKNLGNITTEDDIRLLRRSVELADLAESLQRDARAAINTSSSIEQYKQSEAERAEVLEANMATISKAEAENNYDQAVVALTNEKDRQTMLRDGTGGSPYAEMLAKAKARESEQMREEQKVVLLRDREKQLVSDVAAAEQKAASAKKSKDKQDAQDALAQAKTELNNTRIQITQQSAKAGKAGEEAKLAHANAAFFQQISNDSNVGLTDAERVQLNETELTKLSMRIEEIGNRVASLEINDPQMLALVTEGDDKTSVASNIAVPNTAIAESKKNTETSTSQASTPFGAETASSIRTRKDTRLNNTIADPQLAPASRMFTAQALTETKNAIQILEYKKSTGTITPEELNALGEFRSLEVELNTELAASSAPSMSDEEIRSICQNVAPEYNESIQSINNSDGSEIDRTVMMMQYKQDLIKKLESRRLANANTAAEQSEKSVILEYAGTDGKLESAINALYNQVSDVNQYKAAYETENKAVIESDAVFADKLENQIAVTEKYLTTLNELESEKQREMAVTTDATRLSSVKMQLEAIAAEKSLAGTKLTGYQNDLQLTASASDPTASTDSASVKGTLEDAMEDSMQDAMTATTLEDEKPKIERDVVVIKEMFKPREEAESIFAYESGLFEEIAAQHQKGDTELKNREKIQEINDQIFLIEAEMENEPNPSKLRKLDYKAEQMYLKRSLIEIDNASAIAKMTRAEYDEELSKSNEIAGMNREKVDEKIMVRDEIKRLKRESEINMNNANEIRSQAPAIQDDIEKADYYRRAFAKEALAIEQQRQIQRICENVDMLNNYSDPDLAMLRTGTIPSDQLVQSMAEKTGLDASTMDVTTLTVPEVNESTEVTATDTEPANNIEMTSAASTTSESTNTITEEVSGNTAINFSTTNNGEIVTDTKRVFADDSGVTNVNIVAETPEMVNSASDISNAETVSERTETSAPVAPVIPSNSNASSNAKSSSMASANAADYYYSMPEVLISDLFVRTPRAVYTENKPIPVDAVMPKGVYYKVQIGAFRNNIPQNLYDEFAPVCGETLNNGITRYTAGFFMKFENADQVKREIRSIGYGDAFVVAFRDGKRIPLYEAMGKTDGENFAASVEKEYIYGDKGEAPKASTSANDNSGSSNATVKNAVNNSTISNEATANNASATAYYKNSPNAAKADQVEVIKGLFFTVQVGVYSKPVPAKNLNNIYPLNSELTETKKIRYTTGRFTSMQYAVDKRSEARNMGLKDAFITAYYDGKRITLSEADRLLKDNGPSILAK